MIRVVHPGSRIRMLTFSHPGSRGQKGTQSRIPDPDPQHWLLPEALRNMGSGKNLSWIPDTDPGVKKTLDPRSATLVALVIPTLQYCVWTDPNFSLAIPYVSKWWPVNKREQTSDLWCSVIYLPFLLTFALSTYICPFWSFALSTYICPFCLHLTF